MQHRAKIFGQLLTLVETAAKSNRNDVGPSQSPTLLAIDNCNPIESKLNLENLYIITKLAFVVVILYTTIVSLDRTLYL